MIVCSFSERRVAGGRLLESILLLVNKNINSTIPFVRAVKQEDQLGCGIACVAFILRIKYKDARHLFVDGKRRAKEEANFYCREIAKILESRTLLSCEYKYLKRKLKHKIYKPTTIIFIKRSKKYPFGHYLCRSKTGWMDPWINIPNKKIVAGFRKRLPGKPTYFIQAI